MLLYGRSGKSELCSTSLERRDNREHTASFHSQYVHFIFVSWWMLTAVSSSALSCQQFCSQLSANSNSRVSRLQISFFSSPLARLVLHDIPTTRQFLACLSKMCCSSDPVKDIRASLRKDKSQSVSCLQSVNIHKHEVSSDSRLVSIQSKPIAYWYADQ